MLQRESSTSPTMVAIWWKVAVITIVVVGLLKFMWVLHSRPDFCDLRTPWYAGRVLLSGEDPYNDLNIKKQWISERGVSRDEIKYLPPGEIPGLPQFPMLYCPFYVALLIPLALVPWEAATTCFLLFSVSCICTALALLWRRLSAGGSGLLIFAAILAATFLGEPVTEALTKGQPSAIAALALLVVALRAGNPALQTGALVVATVKPTLCLVLTLWWLLCGDTPRRLKTLVILLVIAAQLLPLLAAGQNYLDAAENYLVLFDFAFGPGGVNSMGNPLATYNVMTLDALLLRLFPAMGTLAVWAIKLAVVGPLAALTLRLFRRSVPLCILNLLCLQHLMFYSRRYDLVLVVMIGFWAISELATSDVRRYVILVALTALVFPHYWLNAPLISGAGRLTLATIVSADMWIMLLLPTLNLALSPRTPTRGCTLQL